MKFYALAAVVIAAVVAYAETTPGTASGSSAPNQLGTPLNDQTNTQSLGTTAPGGGTTFGALRPLDERATTSVPGTFDSTTSTTVDPNLPPRPVPGYALPVPQWQTQPMNDDGTVSGTTSPPTSAPVYVPMQVPMNATPTPTPTP